MLTGRKTSAQKTPRDWNGIKCDIRRVCLVTDADGWTDKMMFRCIMTRIKA